MKQILMTLLLALGLLFWGWSTQVLWLGALLSVVLFLGYALKGKYDFEPSSFYQIANLGGLIVVAIFAVYWLDDRASKAIMPTLGLLPLALLPLLLMQYLSKQGKVPASAILFFQRGKMVSEQWFDVSTLFLFACLFSAGATPHEGTLYFTGISALVLALLLILHHNKHAISNVMIVLVFLVAEAMGIGFVVGMNDLQKTLEAKLNAWILSYNDGNKTSTAIGAVGRLKLSDEIVFRVQLDKSRTAPVLLRESTYQRYTQGEWYGGSWKNIEVPVVNEIWQLVDTDKPTQDMTMYQNFDDEKVVLPLPKGVTSIAEFVAENMWVRQGGRVEVKSPPPFAAFTVSYTSVESINLETNRSDFDIPKAEAKSIAQFAKSLDLYRIKYEQGDAKAVQTLHDYLWNHFTYSLWSEDNQAKTNQSNLNQTISSRQSWKSDSNPPVQTALSQFLWQSKAGHCEYFATATVLILRELGIPARYAVGYSMSEYDKSTGLYLVRGRDAHAWAVALIDEQWVSVDNTPPNWFDAESGDAPFWQGFNDMVSNWVFAFKKWRYNDDEQDTTFWYWILAVMFVFLAYRVLRRVKAVVSEESLPMQDVDEDWLLFEKQLADAGLVRLAGESVKLWLRRIRDGEWQQLGDLHEVQKYSEYGLNVELLHAFERSKQQIRQSLDAEKQDRG